MLLWPLASSPAVALVLIAAGGFVYGPGPRRDLLGPAGGGAGRAAEPGVHDGRRAEDRVVRDRLGAVGGAGGGGRRGGDASGGGRPAPGSGSRGRGGRAPPSAAIRKLRPGGPRRSPADWRLGAVALPERPAGRARLDASLERRRRFHQFPRGRRASGRQRSGLQRGRAGRDLHERAVGGAARRRCMRSWASRRRVDRGRARPGVHRGRPRGRDHWARLLHDERSALALPVGALVFAALPPAWDYATSGLETGLSFGVAGRRLPGAGGRRALYRLGSRRRGRLPSRLDLLAVAIGLGPLVRPDFAIFSAAFFAALLAVQRPASVRSVLRPLLLAVALPARLPGVPHGVLRAARAQHRRWPRRPGLSRWGQGVAYARDTLDTYWLFVPLVLLGAWLAASPARSRPPLPHRPPARTASCLAGALHIVYVIKVGGDYMHARLMLPGSSRC